MAKADLHVKLAGGQQIVGGYSIKVAQLGSMSSFTVNPLLGNYQSGNNVGAFTISAPTVDCAVDLLVNNVTPGTITFSGFQVGNPGDSLTTTAGHRFIISFRRIAGISTYIIKALQ